MAASEDQLRRVIADYVYEHGVGRLVDQVGLALQKRVAQDRIRRDLMKGRGGPHECEYGPGPEGVRTKLELVYDADEEADSGAPEDVAGDDELEGHTNDELRDILRGLGLKVSGRKADLIKRIRQAG